MKTAMLRARKPAKPAQDRTNKEMAEIFKSLADENRLQILRILMREGEMHVSKICAELGESQPAVSPHLTQLGTPGWWTSGATESSTTITFPPTPSRGYCPTSSRTPTGPSRPCLSATWK